MGWNGKRSCSSTWYPISSLFGWIELFKDDYREDENASKLISEIENDVLRLKGVAERFGKIGSSPELKSMDLQPILEEVINYLERRLPQLGKSVDVIKELNSDIKVEINPELFQWAIENFVKNAMDAMKSVRQ